MMNFIGALLYIGRSITNSLKSTPQPIDRVFDYAAAQEILDSIQQIEEKHGREYSDRIADEVSQMMQDGKNSPDLTVLLEQIKQA